MMEEKPYPNSYFIMLGSQGHFFVHPDSTRLVNQTIFNTTDAQQHQDIVTLGYEMISGKQGCMRVDVDGKSCLVSYRSVPNTPWSVALVCPEKDIFKSYHRLTNVIILLVLLSLIPIFLFCHRIVNRAIRPLNRLLDQTQRIAAGDYSVVIPRTKRYDVVGRMQNSFAMMQESINRHVSDIQLINKGWVQRNEELHRARQLIEESDRQKTIFIQNVTHQIRTPLNIILGFAQIMRDSVGSLPLEEVKGFIGMMKHNALSLNRMVLMLYDSSESGATEELNNMHFEPVSCNELIRSAIDATHYRFPDLKISLETVIPDSVCIKSDNVYLMRSLRELLYNSAKYSDGKHISVQVSATDTVVRFVLTDTGRGISDEYYDKMFIPFTKVDDLSEGLGLGLPLAKRHIDNLGGKLILDRDYREGCRFIVEMPIA
jgi:signal transduction histidine kinase